MHNVEIEKVSTLNHVFESCNSQIKQSTAMYCQSSEECAMLHKASMMHGNFATFSLPSFWGHMVCKTPTDAGKISFTSPPHIHGNCSKKFVWQIVGRNSSLKGKQLINCSD
jgi:hypothetical protein